MIRDPLLTETHGVLHYIDVTARPTGGPTAGSIAIVNSNLRGHWHYRWRRTVGERSVTQDYPLSVWPSLYHMLDTVEAMVWLKQFDGRKR